METTNWGKDREEQGKNKGKTQWEEERKKKITVKEAQQ